VPWTTEIFTIVRSKKLGEGLVFGVMVKVPSYRMGMSKLDVINYDVRVGTGYVFNEFLRIG
jgi:hypothetical protein